MRCEAQTASGEQCKSSAMRGAKLCVAHLGTRRHVETMTSEVVDRLVTLFAAGNYITIAVAAAGVPRRTFYEWWARGDPAGSDAKDAPYREMRARVDRAKAEGEARNVALIAKAANTNWQAAAWILERGAPERWARPSQRGEDAERESVPVPVEDDPFAEVDELARKRRQRH